MKSLLLTVLLLTSPFVMANVSAKPDVTLYSYDLSGIQPDADIGLDEYATYFDLTVSGPAKSLSVYWAHNSTNVAIGIEGKFTGWVGFGMNKDGKGMAGADMIIASVVSEEITINDYNSIGNVAPLIDDDEMQIVAAGKDDGSTTTVEFIFPMKSTDSAGNDHNWIEGGEYNFFIAYHSTSDELTYHSGRSDILTLDIADATVSLPENRKVTIGGGSDINFSDMLYGLLLVMAMFGIFIVIVKRNATLS